MNARSPVSARRQRPFGVGDRRGIALEVALGEREAGDDIEVGC